MSLTATVLALNLSLYPIPEPDKEWQVFSNVTVNGYVEDNSVYQLVKGNKGEYDYGSEYAYTFNQAEFGVGYKDLSLAVFSRYEWYLDYSSDTFKVHAQTTNREDVDENDTYNIHLEANHLISEGIKLAYSPSITDNFHTHFAVSYLNAKELMDGKLWGAFTKKGRTDYQGQLYLDYSFTDDELLDYDMRAPKSDYAYTTDVGFTWLFHEKGLFSFYAQDLYSKISWVDAPYNRAEANTARVDTDDNGFDSVRPAAKAILGYQDHIQTLPTKYHARLAYIVDDQSISTKLFSVGDLHIVDFEWSRQWNQQVYTEVNYTPQTGAIGAKLASYGIHLAVKADSTDYQQASAINVSIGYAYQW